LLVDRDAEVGTRRQTRGDDVQSERFVGAGDVHRCGGLQSVAAPSGISLAQILRPQVLNEMQPNSRELVAEFGRRESLLPRVAPVALNCETSLAPEQCSSRWPTWVKTTSLAAVAHDAMARNVWRLASRVRYCVTPSQEKNTGRRGSNEDRASAV
jgi:hypothetical protein